MQYISGNNILTRSYHIVTLNAPSPESGDGVSEAAPTLSVMCDTLTEHTFVKLEIKGDTHEISMRYGSKQLAQL